MTATSRVLTPRRDVSTAGELDRYAEEANPMSSDDNRVLQDHKREGKVFKPLLAAYPNTEGISWKSTTMVELLWIALLIQEYGLREAIPMSLALARSTHEVSSIEGFRWFAATSSYENLSETTQDKIRERVDDEGHLGSLQEGLGILASLYPACPLNFLFDGEINGDHSENGIEKLKGVVASMYDKRSTLPIHAQSQAVFISMATDSLAVPEGSLLTQLEEIKNYPDTGLSRQVGASVCAICNGQMIMNRERSKGEWVDYFWNRGLEIDACEYQLPYGS